MKKCQFFIILGSNKYSSKDVYKVCINISDNELTNYDAIRNKILTLYNEKVGDGIEVSDMIIFLLSDDRYRDVASNIMKHVGITNGRILVVRNTDVKENTTNKEEVVVKPKEENAQEKPAAATTGKVKYGVQVLVTSREMDSNDPFFAGYKPTMIKSGKYFKYVIGVSASQEEVKKTFAKVQKKFPDSFIIRFTE